MRIAECDPPRRLVLEWVGQETGGLEWTSVGGRRTVLRFRQVFAAGADVTDFAMAGTGTWTSSTAEVGGAPGPRRLGRLPGRGRDPPTAA
jgi:hypothetical protein